MQFDVDHNSYRYCLFITGKVVTVFRLIEAARGYLSAVRKGQVSFTLKFAKPLPENTTVIIAAQLQTILRVDPKTRLVQYE